MKIMRFPVALSAFLLGCCLLPAQQGSAPASSGVATTAPSATEEFQKIEDKWDLAIQLRDQYALELVLSPYFMDVSAAGDITTRNQQVATVIGGEDKSLHIDQRVITVRMLGDVAVANGTYALHHRVGTSEANEKGIFTHVYEKTHGGWLCINSQRTILREDANGKQQKKQSTAEMPFHIPLFSRSDKTNQ